MTPHALPARLGWVRLVVAAVLMAGCFVLCGVAHAPSAWAGGPSISGTGSSYAALAINQWDAEVSSEFGDTINYSTTSSVIGLNFFAAYPQVDFGASEIGYSTKQANQNPPSGFNYQYLPDIAGATCMDYNLTDKLGSTIKNLKLNAAALTGIFTGSISSWNDPAIQSLNPGVLLPATPIIVVYRTDASGDNFIFSDYLYTLAQAAWNAFTAATQSPAGPAAIWPSAPSGQRTVGIYNFGNWTGENGSDNASNYVYGNPGSITYVETGYALLHHDPCAAVSNNSGAFVQPSESADAIALQNDVLQADLEQDLSPVFESPQAGAYAISAYSYLVMAEQSEIPSSKQAVEAQYVQFIACDGQKAAGVLGYSPLPLNLVQADFAAVARITGSAIPAPTASNCADPYITGAFNAAPPPTVSNTGGSTASSGGAAVSPVAGSGGSSTSGSHSAGTTGSGTTASGASTAAAATTTTTISPAAQARVAANAVHPVPGQPLGLALSKASGNLLGDPGPTLEIALATIVFLALFITPPLIAGARRRKRAHATQEAGDHA